MQFLFHTSKIITRILLVGRHRLEPKFLSRVYLFHSRDICLNYVVGKVSFNNYIDGPTKLSVILNTQ